MEDRDLLIRRTNRGVPSGITVDQPRTGVDHLIINGITRYDDVRSDGVSVTQRCCKTWTLPHSRGQLG